jgi:superfamily II DNA/RNA helicase
MYIIARPSDLQRQQHLASPRWFGARADVVARLTERLRGAKVKDGDYAPRDLARAVDSRLLIGEVVSEAVRIALGVSKVVFAGGVEHSRQLAAKFNQHGIRAAHLDGETPAKEREDILAALAGGKLEAICNYDVLSEGWDLPSLGAVVLARPFRSRKKYLQVVGRGMRWRSGPRPIVIDHGNNAPRFGIWPGDDVEWSLVGTTPPAGDPLWKKCEGCLERIPLAATVCPECGHECPIERARKEREEADAKLEEATRAEYLALRGRVEAMAKRKAAPPGWVDSVMDATRRRP